MIFVFMTVILEHCKGGVEIVYVESVFVRRWVSDRSLWREKERKKDTHVERTMEKRLWVVQREMDRRLDFMYENTVGALWFFAVWWSSSTFHSEPHPLKPCFQRKAAKPNTYCPSCLYVLLYHSVRLAKDVSRAQENLRAW